MTLLHYSIKQATLEDKYILKNLMQFYFYDFSEFVEAHLYKDGLFEELPNLNSYWEEVGRFPYLVEYNGKHAGFVLVGEVQETDRNYFSIAEFFIMKKYRRTGLGKIVANHVFNLHKGDWVVTQVEKNIPAQKFWVKIIGEYTDGLFNNREENGVKIQEFTS